MDYVSMIKDCGLKATPQRICILKILANHKHPTMDELYEQIRKNYSTVSLATVYKNISVLIYKGIVVEVNAPNQKVKFDIFEHHHMHIVCEKCGAVRDVDFDGKLLDKFQEAFDRKIGNITKRFNVVATTEDCELCR